jgi:GTPase SAR1 family protein
MEKPPRIYERKPNSDELALGYALGEDGEGELYQLKGIPQSDRATHFYIVGASGVGKTKFLEYLIKQDILNGQGFGVIDPHGDLIEAVKEWLALWGEDLDERVLLIDPTDKERSVCFNPLELPEGIDAPELAAELVLVFKKIWGDSWGDRMADIFRNTLIALIENGLTLDELLTFLHDAAFRAKVVQNVKNKTCREYFQYEFDVLNQKTRSEWITSTTNKVRALLADERVRQIFMSPKSSFNFREIMDSGKIILVKLDKGRLKDASEFLGSLILSKIQMAAFSRADIKKREDRKRFYLYIDEFQNFAADSFKETVSEATKYGLSLILAHQNLAQLPHDLRAAVLTCKMQVYFRVSRLDAELLAKVAFVGVFNEQSKWETYIQQLQTLPERVFVVKNASGGMIIVSTPLMRTATIDGMDEEEFASFVAEKNIGGSYLRTRTDIEQDYQARMQALTDGDGAEVYRESKQKKFAGGSYEEVIQRGENNRVEFKQSLRWEEQEKTDKPNKTPEYFVSKSISAFMNSEGGTLFIGVKDNGEIDGIESDYATLKKGRDGFLLYLDQTINKFLGKEFNQFTDVKIVPLEGKDVCIVEVSASVMPVYVKNGDKDEFYTRASASSQPMGVREANEYIKTHFADRI